MFERFTDRSRRVLVVAREEARQLGHGYLGTEHILLALLREDDGPAARALSEAGVRFDTARARVEQAAPSVSGAGGGSPPFTTRAKRALELSLREALALGDDHIRPEHLLLGLVREGDGTAAGVLRRLGVDLGRLGDQLRRSGPSSPRPPTGLAPSAPAATARLARPGRGGGRRWVRRDECGFCGRDLWDVGRYVTGPRLAVCADCLDRAVAALAGSAQGEVVLGPRLYGAAPDDGAVTAVTAAFTGCFGPDPHLADAAPDAAELEAAWREVQGHGPGAPRPPVVERIRFPDADTAEVVFAPRLGPGPGPRLEGRARRAGGGWVVTRETVVRAVAAARRRGRPVESPGPPPALS